MSFREHSNGSSNEGESAAHHKSQSPGFKETKTETEDEHTEVHPAAAELVVDTVAENSDIAKQTSGETTGLLFVVEA